MNRLLHFFSYEQCYNYYTKRIDSIRQKIIEGEVIVAKPALLIAIIDSIDENIFVTNQFVINDSLEEQYKKLMQKYTKDSRFDRATGIEKPFWHLESDGFWHLNYLGEQLSKRQTPSKAWLKENVKFAYFDESLWILLQNRFWRTKLRDYIIEHKLTDSLLAQKIKGCGLGVLAAILLTA